MRLSTVLFRRNRLPNGNLFRGKDRLVKEVKPSHLRQLNASFAVEEQNMFFLRFPYLTEEESRGHSKELGKAVKRIQKFVDTNRRMFKNDVTLLERLQHLRVKETWD